MLGSSKLCAREELPAPSYPRAQVGDSLGKVTWDGNHLHDEMLKFECFVACSTQLFWQMNKNAFQHGIELRHLESTCVTCFSYLVISFSLKAEPWELVMAISTTEKNTNKNFSSPQLISKILRSVIVTIWLFPHMSFTILSGKPINWTVLTDSFKLRFLYLWQAILQDL